MRIPPRLGALVAIVFWGISFVATKAALRDVSPITLIFVRFFIGTAFLLVALRAWPPRDAWRELFVMGLVGVFIHQMLQAYALTMTSAVSTGWLVGVIPIWSAILSALLLKERFGWKKTVGITVALAGALLVITRGHFSRNVMQLPATKGDFLVLLSTVNWAVYSVIGHKTIRRIGPQRATTGAFLAGVVLLAPFFVAKAGWRELPHLSTSGWGAILFLGIGCSGLGYLFWYGALEQIEVSKVAVLLYLEPFVTFIAAVALLHEPVSTVAVAGGTVVIAGVLLASRG
ncbi:MAG: EamA family transporter [Acidobacteria bacterium]|nr:EamA family transporter [Acidobacteriota bacterium]